MTEITKPFLNLLFVEDDRDDREFITDALEKLNIPYEVSFAMDCFEIFKLFGENKVFDIIFMDINLPLMNGKDCLKQIKADERHKHIPVIIFTGSSAQMDIDFGYNNGAHYHVVKPIAHINFVASLKIVLGINWKEKPPRPPFEKYIINLTFSS